MGKLDVVAVVTVLAFLGGILKGILSVRDVIRDTLNSLEETLGKQDPYPGTGLIGRITRIEDRQDEHRGWFIASGLAPNGTPHLRERDMRRQPRRHHHDDEEDGA